MKRALKFLIPMVALFVLTVLLVPDSPGTEKVDREELDKYFDVQRGDFNIELMVDGSLEAVKEHRIRYLATARHGLTVKEIVENGAKVKKDEMIVTFYDDDYQQKKSELETTLAEKKADFESSKADRKLVLEQKLLTLQEKIETEITKYEDLVEKATEDYEKKIEDHDTVYADALENLELEQDDFDVHLEIVESDLKSYYQDVKTALENYDNYLNTDSGEKKKKHYEDILTAEETFLEVEDNVRKKRIELNDTEFGDIEKRKKLETELSQMLKRLDKERDNIDSKRKAYRRFVQVLHPDEVFKLDKARNESRLSMGRFVNKQRRVIIDYMRNFRKSREKIAEMEVERKELIEKRAADVTKNKENHEARMEALKTEKENLIAAHENKEQQAAYQFEQNNRRLTKQLDDINKNLESMVLRSPVDGIVTLAEKPEEPFEQGSKMHRGRVIAVIPDLSRFLVKCRVPEAYRFRLAINTTALLNSPAIPDMSLQGKVVSISAKSRPMVRWDQNSPKVYDVVISTDTTHSSMMPGMSIQANFHLETVEDVLYVPVEAVYERDEAFFVMVKGLTGTKEVEIQTGQYSDRYVEVTSGLSPGDTVILDLDQIPSDGV